MTQLKKYYSRRETLLLGKRQTRRLQFSGLRTVSLLQRRLRQVLHLLNLCHFNKIGVYGTDIWPRGVSSCEQSES